jgi:hypothetical protein
MSMFTAVAHSATPLPGGDFESGSLAGWEGSGNLGGFVAVADRGTCFSSFDTSGIVLPGNYSALIRAGRESEPGSTGVLTSAPFTAGIGVVFSALTESIRSANLPEMPVEFTVRILSADGNPLSAVGLKTAVVELNGGCYEYPVNGAFSTHYIDTRKFTGTQIRIQFMQTSKVRRAGLFTLVDDVIRLDAEDAQVLPDRPRAVAGFSRSGSGRLRLDGSLSSDPTGLFLTHIWTLEGEHYWREGEFPCIDDLEPGAYQAALVVTNGVHQDADTLHFVVQPEPPPVPGDGGGDENGSEAESATESETGDSDEQETLIVDNDILIQDCSDSPTEVIDDDVESGDSDTQNDTQT